MSLYFIFRILPAIVMLCIAGYLARIQFTSGLKESKLKKYKGASHDV